MRRRGRIRRVGHQPGVFAGTGVLDQEDWVPSGENWTEGEL